MLLSSDTCASFDYTHTYIHTHIHTLDILKIIDLEIAVGILIAAVWL